MNEAFLSSRRRFLRHTATALGAALTAPTLLPGSVLGRGGMIPPSERVTMGFIGVGGQGGGHLLGGAWTYVAGGYAGRKDVQVLAVCDVWRDRRERACKQVNDGYAQRLGKATYKPCEPYTDFRQVLDRSDIDAVLIATPAHWHATMAAMAAAAGKDVYCEKPTAVTIRESQAVLSAVRRYGRVYQAGTQQRCEYGGKFGRPANSSAVAASESSRPSMPTATAGPSFGPSALAPAGQCPRTSTGTSTWDPRLGFPTTVIPAPTGMTSVS